MAQIEQMPWRNVPMYPLMLVRLPTAFQGTFGKQSVITFKAGVLSLYCRFLAVEPLYEPE